ncbi:MAG: YdcF family protein [Bryobacteraceae bacterium]|nr:YdcF family protein [Bryobacteraceae bacterium]
MRGFPVLQGLRNLLALIGAAVLVITLTPVTGGWARWLTGNRWDVPAGDTMVVLGAEASHKEGALMSQHTYWRSVAAVRAWREGHFRQVAISGGNGTAESMADYMTAHGVPAAALRLETRSTSTRENAIFTAELLHQTNPGKVALLTSDFHMRRAVAAFAKAGFRDMVVLPSPDAGKRALSLPHRWQVFIDLATATTKLAWYRWNSYI